MDLQRLINKLSKVEAEFLLHAMRNNSNAYYEYKDGREYDYYGTAHFEDHLDNAFNFTVLLANKIGLKEEE